jgi:hypothetical protein
VPGVPSRINELGIPVGYPHTEAGAISACANYSSAWGDVHNREPSRIKAVFNAIAVPESATRLANKIIENDKEIIKVYGQSSIEAPGLNFNTRSAGYATRSYNENSADITIWGIVGLGLYGSKDPKLAPRQGWGTDYCSLSWNAGDWKVTDASDGPSTPDINERAAEGFHRFILVGAGT